MTDHKTDDTGVEPDEEYLEEKAQEDANEDSKDTTEESTEETPEEPTESVDTAEDVEEEIPVRAHKAFVEQRIKIKQQQEEIDRLRQAKEEPEEDIQEETQEEPSGLEARLAAIEAALGQSTNDKELNELFSSEPDAKKYEPRIKAYMEHEEYRGVPPSVIYHHLAYNEAKSSGAKEKQLADLEAEQMGGAGSSHRPVERPTGNLPTAEEIANMSEEEFETLENKARSGDFLEN